MRRFEVRTGGYFPILTTVRIENFLLVSYQSLPARGLSDPQIYSTRSRILKGDLRRSAPGIELGTPARHTDH